MLIQALKYISLKKSPLACTLTLAILSSLPEALSEFRIVLTNSSSVFNTLRVSKLCHLIFLAWGDKASLVAEKHLNFVSGPSFNLPVTLSVLAKQFNANGQACPAGKSKIKVSLLSFALPVVNLKIPLLYFLKNKAIVVFFVCFVC